MPTNDFKAFATGPGANVIPQVTYEGNLSLLASGYVAGVADPLYLNKTWRQSSIMAAVIGDFIVTTVGRNVVDDGTTPTIVLDFTDAVREVASSGIRNAAANYYEAVTFGGF